MFKVPLAIPLLPFDSLAFEDIGDSDYPDLQSTGPVLAWNAAESYWAAIVIVRDENGILTFGPAENEQSVGDLDNDFDEDDWGGFLPLPPEPNDD